MSVLQIAFEEQEQAFLPTGPDEVKIVIATNAAESSITLPDVDDVICLGTHKALRYDPATHRVHLANTWISKASATQRAGRTGRVRPGHVYRVYSRELYDKFQEHEESEVLRRTLQDTLLRLWAMLETSQGFSGVEPVLAELPEPPDLSNVAKSFYSLYASGMITKPANDGLLTSFGRFAGNLPVDMQLGQLIGYGIALGIGTEAVVMAAALSQPQPVFRRASPFVHQDPDEFNSIVRTSFLSAVQLDSGAYSEPIMGLYLFKKWMSMSGSKEQHAWAMKAGVSHVRVHQFVSSAMNLIRTTKDALKHSNKEAEASIDADALLKSTGPLSTSVLNRLRMVLVWTCEGNILSKTKMANVPKAEFSTVHIKTPQVTYAQMATLLPTSKPRAICTDGEVDLNIPWRLKSGGRRIYDARVGQKRSSGSIEELLKDLYAAASSAPASRAPTEVVSIYVDDGNGTISSPMAPVVWFIQQPQPSAAAADDGTVVIIAIPVGDDEVQDHSCNVYFRILSSVFADKLSNAGTFDCDPDVHAPEHEAKDGVDTDGAHQGEQAVGCHGQRMVMFQVLHASKRELLYLNKMHEALPISVSMLVPTLGTAKVTATNCLPTLSQLQRIFFGDRQDENAHSDLESELIALDESKGLRKISEQIIGSQQTIDFTEGDNGDNGGSRRGLLDDLPLGMRLIDSYRLAYSDSHLRMWRDEEQVTPAVSSPIPSRAGGKPGPAPNNDVVVVSVKSAMSAWQTLPGVSMHPPAETENGPNRSSELSKQAILPKHSVPAVALHRGRESMYAVSFGSLVIGSGKKMVVCNGVTLCPPGWQWLFLALSCLGCDASCILMSEKRAGGNVKQVSDEFGDAELAALTEVCGLIQALPHRAHVGRSDDLIDALEKCFARWIV